MRAVVPTRRTLAYAARNALPGLRRGNSEAGAAS